MLENIREPFIRYYPDGHKRHLSHGDVSLDAYIKASKIALGQRIAKKRRIYLDTKYWIYCLDAFRGRAQQPIHTDIANTLMRLVETGVAVCPAHYALFTEVSQIGCPARRQELAKLIDYFSTKVTIVPPLLQEQAEFFNFVRSCKTNVENRHSIMHMVWEPVGAVLGLQMPEVSDTDSEILTAMQKSCYDFIATLGLEELFVELSDGPSSEDWPSLKDMSDSLKAMNDSLIHGLNEDTEAHRKDYQSFEDVFLIELQGALDAMRPQIASGFEHLAVSAGYTLSEQDISDDFDSLEVRQFCSLILEAYKQNILSTQWPSLHITAGIHAAIRYEQRRLKRGDMSDHLHAKAALPYCDMFLTERVLGTLITGKYLRFDKKYNCKVLWKDAEVLNALQAIA